jgi:hypothetical protein
MCEEDFKGAAPPEEGFEIVKSDLGLPYYTNGESSYILMNDYGKVRWDVQDNDLALEEGVIHCGNFEGSGKPWCSLSFRIALKSSLKEGNYTEVRNGDFLDCRRSNIKVHRRTWRWFTPWRWDYELVFDAGLEPDRLRNDP